MNARLFALVGALAIVVLSPAAGASPAAQAGSFPARIDLPNGFFPEGIERGPGTSFFVGSLLERRCPELMVGVLADLAAEHPDLRLVMAGPDRLRDPERFARLARERGVAERVLVLSSSPTVVQCDLPIDLPKVEQFRRRS